MVGSCLVGQSQRRQEQHETSEAAKNGAGGVEWMRRHRAKAALILCTCLLHPMGTKGDSPNYVGRELSDYNGKFGRGIKLEVNRQATPQSALLSALCLSLPRTLLLFCLCIWCCLHLSMVFCHSPVILSFFLRFVCRMENFGLARQAVSGHNPKGLMCSASKSIMVFVIKNLKENKHE